MMNVRAEFGYRGRHFWPRVRIIPCSTLPKCSRIYLMNEECMTLRQLSEADKDMNSNHDLKLINLPPFHIGISIFEKRWGLNK